MRRPGRLKTLHHILTVPRSQGSSELGGSIQACLVSLGSFMDLAPDLVIFWTATTNISPVHLIMRSLDSLA
jgi:hypothetical protein